MIARRCSFEERRCKECLFLEGGGASSLYSLHYFTVALAVLPFVGACSHFTGGVTMFGLCRLVLVLMLVLVLGLMWKVVLPLRNLVVNSTKGYVCVRAAMLGCLGSWEMMWWSRFDIVSTETGARCFDHEAYAFTSEKKGEEYI